jgi:hypothetical protein
MGNRLLPAASEYRGSGLGGRLDHFMIRRKRFGADIKWTKMGIRVERKGFVRTEPGNPIAGGFYTMKIAGIVIVLIFPVFLGMQDQVRHEFRKRIDVIDSHAVLVIEGLFIHLWYEHKIVQVNVQ